MESCHGKQDESGMLEDLREGGRKVRLTGHGVDSSLLGDIGTVIHIDLVERDIAVIITHFFQEWRNGLAGATPSCGP